MIRILTLACALFLFQVGALLAQPLPPDLAAVPEEIKNLRWQGIDPASEPPLQLCRAFLFLNHALDELSATATSEADLMSSFVEQQGLSGDFVKLPPAGGLSSLSFADAEKIALALLQGPMSGSTYNTAFADMSPDTLSAYAQMYSQTCQRRWSELQEARSQVRNLSAFLTHANKMQEYQTWATAESEKRQQAYEAQQAQQRAAAQEAAAQQAANNEQLANEQTAQLQQQNLQLQQALSNAQYQQQQQAQIAQAEQVQNPAPGGVPQVYNTNYDSYFPPPYYSGDASWCYNNAYASQGRVITEGRMSNWYGAPAHGRR